MSTLYTGSATLLNDFLRNKTPLTSLVYAPHSPVPDKQKKAAYALLLGTLRYKSVLEEVLEKTNFMKLDKKMNRALVLLMLYDLLLGESRSIAGGGTVKKLLLSHSNLLRTTLVRVKIARGVSSDEELLPREIRFTAALPRYARVNVARTTLEHVVEALKQEGYELQKEKYDRDTKWNTSSSSPKPFYLDAHIPNLLVFPPGTDLHDHVLLHSGQLILQDKASCMPATILNPCAPDQQGLGEEHTWHVLDACAAPGNKTTHLLAIALEELRKKMKEEEGVESAATHAPADNEAAAPANTPSSSPSSSRPPFSKKPRRSSALDGGEADELDSASSSSSSHGKRQGRHATPTGAQVTFHLGAAAQSASVNPRFKLEAFEVDPTRFQLLTKMMTRALPTPFKSESTHRALVAPPTPPTLPPNCPPLPPLPCPPARVILNNRSFLDVSPSDPRYANVTAILLDPTCSGSGMLHRIEQFYKHRVEDEVSRNKGGKQLEQGVEKEEVMENVEALAAFQKEIVQHALKFPKVQIVCYSTCSVHAAEDECVVRDVLASVPGRSFTLSPALPTWPRRGQPFDTDLSEEEAARTVRVAGAEDGMNGFYVAKFVRKDTKTAGEVQPADKEEDKNKKQAQLAASKAEQSAPTSSQSQSKKRGREESEAEEEGEEAEEEADSAQSSSSAAPALTGKQSARNKKKRAKAKLKKMKLQAEGEKKE